MLYTMITVLQEFNEYFRMRIMDHICTLHSFIGDIIACASKLDCLSIVAG